MCVLKTPLLTAKCALKNESCCLYSPMCVAAEGKKHKAQQAFLVSFASIPAGYEITRIKRTIGGIGKVDSGDDRDLGRKTTKN